MHYWFCELGYLSPIPAYPISFASFAVTDFHRADNHE
ncbi:MAG: hypothetical protein QG662_2330 [Pseudomonadota bacterium]|nr:hypothetical protein [Pseudomonadota bacterium]